MVGQSPELGNWKVKSIWYSAGLLDASKTMLTPSTERTEKKSQTAQCPDRTEQGTVSEPRIKEWWKVERKASAVRI